MITSMHPSLPPSPFPGCPGPPPPTWSLRQAVSVAWSLLRVRCCSVSHCRSVSSCCWAASSFDWAASSWLLLLARASSYCRWWVVFVRVQSEK